ncbi:hypothetical protein WJX73_006784 [Symbiochloris irregularis]|uniref:Uncharacterized protein n=1 Tax=Symbiochloris irregularis TaxID=706552 RepID=A0AAW1NP35_9CHLO
MGPALSNLSSEGRQVRQAAERGDSALVKKILEKRPGLASSRTFGSAQNIAHRAARLGLQSVLQALVECVPATEEQQDDSSRSRFGFTRDAQRPHLKDILNARDRKGNTPCMVACQHRQTEHVRVQDVTGENRYLDSRAAQGMTALHVAAMHGHVECVRLLMEAGASLMALTVQALEDPQAIVPSGSTALHLAAHNGSVPTIQALLQAHADGLGTWGGGGMDAGTPIRRGWEGDNRMDLRSLRNAAHQIPFTLASQQRHTPKPQNDQVAEPQYSETSTLSRTVHRGPVTVIADPNGMQAHMPGVQANGLSQFLEQVPALTSPFGPGNGSAERGRHASSTPVVASTSPPSFNPVQASSLPLPKVKRFSMVMPIIHPARSETAQRPGEGIFLGTISVTQQLQPFISSANDRHASSIGPEAAPYGISQPASVAGVIGFFPMSVKENIS